MKLLLLPLPLILALSCAENTPFPDSNQPPSRITEDYPRFKSDPSLAPLKVDRFLDGTVFIDGKEASSKQLQEVLDLSLKAGRTLSIYSENDIPSAPAWSFQKGYTLQSEETARILGNACTGIGTIRRLSSTKAAQARVAQKRSVIIKEPIADGDYPSSWLKIGKGMTSEEVRKRIGQPQADGDELKQLDRWYFTENGVVYHIDLYFTTGDRRTGEVFKGRIWSRKKDY